MRITPCLTALFAAFCASATAQVINVDFDEFNTTSIYQGLAAAPDPAGGAAVWNRLTGSGTTTISASGLVNSAGNATGVGLNLSISGSFLNPTGEQELGSYEDLMADYIYAASSGDDVVVTRSGTLSGLDPSKIYDVYLYGQGDHFTVEFDPGQNTLFTINGVSKQTRWDGIPGGNGLLVEGIEYVRFSVQPDALGAINFSYANVVSGPGGNVATDLDGSNSRFGVINGIQIVVPEPSVALLAAFGLLPMLRRRR